MVVPTNILKALLVPISDALPIPLLKSIAIRSKPESTANTTVFVLGEAYAEPAACPRGWMAV